MTTPQQDIAFLFGVLEDMGAEELEDGAVRLELAPALDPVDVCAGCGSPMIGVAGTQLALECPACSVAPRAVDYPARRVGREHLAAREARDEYGHDLHAFVLTGDTSRESRAVCRRCGAIVNVKVERDGAAKASGSAVSAHCGQERIGL